MVAPLAGRRIGEGRWNRRAGGWHTPKCPVRKPAAAAAGVRRDHRSVHRVVSADPLDSLAFGQNLMIGYRMVRPARNVAGQGMELNMAMAAKTDESPSDKIMTAGAMKPILAVSKREPVQAAVGLTSTGDGVILLDKKKKPKQLLAILKADAKKNHIVLQAATLRFGKAEVDTDYDPGMVRFFLNKEAPGNLRAKLVLVVKKIPYQKVELNVDTSFEDEPEDETEEVEVSGTDTGSDGIPDAPEMPPVTQAPPPDVAALTRLLAGLVRRIPEAAGAEPAVKAALAKLATDANVNLKTNNLKTAAELITRLRDELGEVLDSLGVGIGQVTEPGQTVPPAPPLGGQQTQPPPAPPLGGQQAPQNGVVAYAKSRLAWLAVRGKMTGDIDKLRSELVATYSADGIAADIESRFRGRVAPILTSLDESLADKLDAATNETDPEKRAALVAEAKAIITKYQDFVNNDGIFVELDENPFVPLAIKKTLTSTLSTLAAAVH
jgi:hypothetical protein